MIPKIINQTWKTKEIPKKWRPFVRKVRELNPDWEYKLWTDADIDEFVAREYPDFTDVFQGFSRQIMRVDVIRYLIMHKTGGVYLDLDYEVLIPFDFGNKEIILPQNRSIEFEDEKDELGNCFFASVPGHRFWLDVITDLKQNPPLVTDYTQVYHATGPQYLTRIFNEKNYSDVYSPERLVYHPPSPHSKKDIRRIKNNGISLGIHHPWGSWKERWTLAYIRDKAQKITCLKNKL